MAITKMDKVTVIAEKAHQEAILQTIQGLQNIEIRDLSKETENNAWVQEYFSGSFDQLIETRESDLDRLQQEYLEAMQFIEHHGKQKEQKLESLKRRFISLQEMEEVFDEERFRTELNEILDLKQQWKENQDRKNDLTNQEDWLTGWQYLDMNPNDGSSGFTSFAMATASSSTAEAFLEELKKHELIYFEEIFSGEKESHIAIIYHKEAGPALNGFISQYSVQTEVYPYDRPPKEMLKEVKDQLKNVYEESRKLSEVIGSKRSIVGKLQWADEVILAMRAREKVKQELIQAQYLIVIQGWISVSDKELLTEALKEHIGENEVYVDFEAPSEFEISEEVPTKLKNNAIVRPFEMLTEMYSLPKYGEVDPTPWFTPFYMVFFGMMVADIGYGLLMLIGTTVALKYLVLPRGMTRFAKFFQVLSIPTILWGVIYGSIFGASTPFPPILSTSDDVMQILLLSVIFGFIQLMVGLFITAKEHMRKKEYLDAVNDGFAWQGVMIGIAIALVGNMLADSKTLTMIGAGVAVVSAISILVIPMIQSSSKIAGFAMGAYNLYGITGYVGDLVSYTRLMALGISGGSIAAAFNLLVAFMPPIARFSVGIFLIIALHALNIFLSLLGAYVHGARLQYVEFFGKFYNGGGRAFDPFKTEERYVNIEANKKRKSGGK